MTTSENAPRENSPHETAPRAPAQPPRYKQAIITWLGVYAALTLILALLGPVMESWPLPLRTLLVTLLIVPALTWVILPLLREDVGQLVEPLRLMQLQGAK